MNEMVKIEIVNGVEGKSVYIDDSRVAGNKPWGGAKVQFSFKANKEDILMALKIMPTRIEGRQDKPGLEDEIEKMYWEFDSEKKKGSLSERDIFKKKMRRLIHLCNEIEGEKP